MVYLFVCGESVQREDESDDVWPSTTSTDECRQSELETSFFQFSAFVDNLNFLYPGIFATLGPNSFKHFDQFCMAKGFPYSAVFITEREFCCFCGAKLTICKAIKMLSTI